MKYETNLEEEEIDLTGDYYEKLNIFHILKNQKKKLKRRKIRRIKRKKMEVVECLENFIKKTYLPIGEVFENHPKLINRK